MKWFKHDTDANSDNKLQNVLLDYGLEGYGLYWYCLELIAGGIEADNLTFQLEHDARIIARNTGCTTKKIEEIMRYFVNVGLFECSDGTITCLKMAKRLDKSMTSNNAMRSMIKDMRVSSNDYSGFVYFIAARNGEQSKIKIGRSKNPTARLAELKKRDDCAGFELEILHKIKTDDCVSLETMFHRMFKHINIVNEWFVDCDELISHINSLRHDVINLRDDYDMQEEIRRDKKRIETLSESGDSSGDVGQQKTQRIDYQAIADAYNSALGDRLPKCSKITEPRKKAIKKLLAELAEPTPEAAGKYFSAFASKASGFHFGENDRGWKADFDYVVRVETLIKTREGAL